MGTKTRRKKQKQRRVKLGQQRKENDAEQARKSSTRRFTAVYSVTMPVLPHKLPKDVRVIDAGGGHAVALACCGIFLGLYLREEP